MNQTKRKTVLITGASAGIGAATALEFARISDRVILCARRRDRLEILKDQIEADLSSEAQVLQMDISSRQSVDQGLASLDDSWGQIDILVNNAGMAAGMDKLADGDPDDWKTMLDINVGGLLYVTRKVLPGMIERGSGHIINVGSIAGHESYPGGAVYCATKSAVRAITNSLRMELVDTQLRVTTVDPGLVETEFSIVRFKGDKERARTPYKGIEPLVGKDIAEVIVFAANRPAHVNLNEIIVMPTSQASTTLVSRNE